MSTPEPGSKTIHVYDDIHEEDNHLPNWWLAILFGAIVFSFGYWFVFHTSKLLPSPQQVYRDDVAALNKKLALANPTSDEALVALSADATAVAEGKAVFTSTCVACHLPDGRGLVGPNLTDKFWIHGSKPRDILTTVTNGWPDKGMPPWGRQLGEDKVRKVTAFVLTIKNTNVAGGKAPQGDPVEP